MHIIKNIEPSGTDLERTLLQKDRTSIIDVFRGWVLIGVVIVNYSIFYNLGNETKNHVEEGTIKFLMGMVQVFFGNKSWTLLSFLFGYEFSILLTYLKRKCINSNVFFIRRMMWLFIIRLVNSCFRVTTKVTSNTFKRKKVLAYPLKPFILFYGGTRVRTADPFDL